MSQANRPALHAAVELVTAEVAPDEVDLAAGLLDAYVAGGRDRADLFRRPRGSPVAAFGGEVGLMMPSVFAALAAAAATVLPVLGRLLTPSANAIDCTNKVLELRRQRRMDVVETEGLVRAAAPGEADDLLRLIDAVESTLAAEGFAEELRGRVALGCVKAFLARPAEMTELVGAVAADQ